MTKKYQAFFGDKSSDFSRDTYIEQEAYNNDELNHLLKLGPYRILKRPGGVSADHRTASF